MDPRGKMQFRIYVHKGDMEGASIKDEDKTFAYHSDFRNAMVSEVSMFIQINIIIEILYQFV